MPRLSTSKRWRAQNPRDRASNRAMIVGGVLGAAIPVMAGFLGLRERGFVVFLAFGVGVGLVVGLILRVVFGVVDRRRGEAPRAA